MLITASEIITKSIELYKKNLRLFLVYAALISVPALIAMVLSWVLFPEFAFQNTVALNEMLTWDFLGLTLVNLLGGLISFWVSIGFIQVIADRYKDRKAKTITEELEAATNLIIPALVVSILTSIAIFLGFLLLIIPGVIFSVWFAFAVYEVILDDQTGVSAIKSSKSLVEGRWWGVLWRLLVPAFVFGLVVVLLQALVEFFFGLFVSQQRLIVEIVAVVISFVVMPLTTAATAILYIELKRTPVEETKPHPDPDKKQEEGTRV